ncbi:hypothetical protein ACH3XW_8375 [Acanthocheilonema viteae]|uniref:NADAR domain-containing protein n=1 Tax=Acanthocheilonema viteae TaxID=6277 RepID=A0A498S3M2_ACAVI|nr:unnamed protein product [Acanthocheilonema viteae]
MDDGKIILIGNEGDILHCGYSHTLSDGGKRYPSADHYAHAMILTQLGLDEALILELLCTSSADVPVKARQLLQENMPTGHDMNSLASYLQTSRQSYTMQGLRIRVEQDAAFEKALMDTKDALLIVCDARDSELGIGMDEDTFVDWMAKEKVDAAMLGHWMRNERGRPPQLGHNQLGYFLMWLRYEVSEKRRAALLSTQSIEVDGISTDQNGDTIKTTTSDLVLSLQGIFRPLSNYYALSFDMKGEKYRSVEHYAYQRLFDALRLDDKCIEKIRTTVDPSDVALVARRVFKQQKLSDGAVDSKMGRLDRWRQSAMKHKMTKNEALQQLLLSTGHALLIDTTESDKAWASTADEFELQHLLTKRYILPGTIIDWMTERTKPPSALSHIRGNKTGLLLMELRSKFAALSPTQNRIPLVSPLVTAMELRTLLSAHMICFTAESVFHFLYPAQIRLPNAAETLPSPAHYIAKQAIRYFNICAEDAAYINESIHSTECWYRMNTIVESSNPTLDKVQGWYMDERQRAIKVALTMMFEQHPPLMRALLDTGDALLVYCSRYSSLEAELTVGMRERDLRAWLAQIDIDTRQLFDSTVRPLAFRPPYLGGNRLGLILMEIRREFMLRGVFPQQLPELQIGVEAVLGSESPAENYVSIYPFDVLNSDNFTALWTNPFLLLAKQNKDGELWTQANSVKLAPKLISINEATLSAIVDELDVMEKVTEDDLENYSVEDLRAVFVRLALRMRNRLVETEAQQNEMNLLAREITAMQNMRRALEERKVQLEGGPMQERREKRELPPPLVRTELPPLLMRGYSPPRKWDEKRKPIQRRYSPPEEKLPRRRSPARLKSPPSHIVRKSSPSSKLPLKQQKVMKPPVDESELSDGEILSD